MGKHPSQVFVAWEALKRVMGEGAWQWTSGTSDFEGLRETFGLEWHRVTQQHVAADHGGLEPIMGIVPRARSPQISLMINLWPSRQQESPPEHQALPVPGTHNVPSGQA